MAAPQTHLVLVFVIRAILTFVFDITFSIWELISMYFWGSLVDFADHFWSPRYVKDVIFIRIPRFLKGGDVGIPSKDVKVPPMWLHLWPGLIVICIWTVGFWFINASFMIWIPFVFWFKHKMVDRYQKNDETYPYYHFLHPFIKKMWVQKRGYPTKHRIEVLIGTVLAGLIVLFEMYYNFLR